MSTLTSCAQLLDQIGRQGDAHASPQRALHLYQIEVDDIFPRRGRSTRTGLLDPNAWLSRKTTSTGLSAARKPGPSLARLIRARYPPRPR